jgi:peptide-methionine (S)-S-oxide reductase
VLFSRTKTQLPTAETALPGRSDYPFDVPETHVVTGNRIVPPFPEGLATAVFALGCFWGEEKAFWQVDGVWSTAVGYTGGITPYPTYEEVCSGLTGHAEAVLVVYDPEKVSYEQLLQVFWEAHDPTQGMRRATDVGTQYRSAIYYADEEQKKAAEASRDAFQPEAVRVRLRHDHHGDRAGRPVLLRRGLPPAIPGEEPVRLLPRQRHRRQLPVGLFAKDAKDAKDA